jgi:hypothetical protein
MNGESRMASVAPGLKAAIRLPGTLGIELRFTFRAGNQHGCGYRWLPIGCTVYSGLMHGFYTGLQSRCKYKWSLNIVPMESKNYGRTMTAGGRQRQHPNHGIG